MSTAAANWRARSRRYLSELDESYDNQSEAVVRKLAPLWKKLDIEVNRPSMRAEVLEVLAGSRVQNIMGEV